METEALEVLRERIRQAKCLYVYALSLMSTDATFATTERLIAQEMPGWRVHPHDIFRAFEIIETVTLVERGVPLRRNDQEIWAELARSANITVHVYERLLPQLNLHRHVYGAHILTISPTD